VKILTALLRSTIQLAGNVCAKCGCALPVGQVMYSKCAAE
jgi:hypothetical protein